MLTFHRCLIAINFGLILSFLILILVCGPQTHFTLVCMMSFVYVMRTIAAFKLRRENKSNGDICEQ